jgi:phytoene synthase
MTSSSPTADAGTVLGRRQSYLWCEQLARRAAGNFYHGFRLLPATQRLGMCALYSFMRIADDLADDGGPPEARRQALADWRQQLDDALGGVYRHPLHAALHDTVDRFVVPRRHLLDVLDGVEMDLDTTRYETFADLYRYCYRVASAVGLACIRIWGCTAEAALAPAEAAGIALQLTNILRDLGEDATRGRIYLPREDLERFGYGEEDLHTRRQGDSFQELMRFEVERARRYYDAALSLTDFLPPPGRAVFLVMLRTYRGLLDVIVRRGYDVFSRRASLSRWHKLWLAVRVLPLRWGWG